MSLILYKRVKGWDFHFLFSNCCRIHIAVTLLHTADGMADQLIKDITNLMDEIMKNPKKPVEGEVKQIQMDKIAKGKSNESQLLLHIFSWPFMGSHKLCRIALLWLT